MAWSWMRCLTQPRHFNSAMTLRVQNEMASRWPRRSSERLPGGLGNRGEVDTLLPRAVFNVLPLMHCLLTNFTHLKRNLGSSEMPGATGISSPLLKSRWKGWQKGSGTRSTASIRQKEILQTLAMTDPGDVLWVRLCQDQSHWASALGLKVKKKNSGPPMRHEKFLSTVKYLTVMTAGQPARDFLHENSISYCKSSTSIVSFGFVLCFAVFLASQLFWVHPNFFITGCGPFSVAHLVSWGKRFQSPSEAYSCLHQAV